MSYWVYDVPGAGMAESMHNLPQPSREIWRAELSSPLSRWGKQGSERHSDVPQVSQHQRAKQDSETRIAGVLLNTNDELWWKRGPNKKLLQNELMKFSQLTKNEAGIHFADGYLTVYMKFYFLAV